MPPQPSSVSAADRAALLRDGIVVVETEAARGRLWVGVTGACSERVIDRVVRRLGDDVDVDVLHDLPRRIVPRRCVGHMEREPGRLQLRFALRGDEHMDDIVVAEDERSLVVFATVCTSVSGEEGAWCEGPWHVYLECPLGDRTVIDGTSGDPVPYKNIYAALELEFPP